LKLVYILSSNSCFSKQPTQSNGICAVGDTIFSDPFSLIQNI